MGEKETVFQSLQIGLETVPGTPVAANKKLMAASLTPQPRMEADAFRAAGNKYASFVTLNKEWSEIGIEGKVSYNEIVYLLSSLLSAPTPTQQASTTAYKWTFLSNLSSADAAKYMTVEQGDADTAWRVAGARCSGLTFTFNRSEVSMSGSMFGEKLETGITLTATPTAITAVPILPGQLSFKMADTQAGLAAATAMTRGFSMTFGLTDKAALAWPVGQDPISVEGVPTLESTLRVATNSEGIGLVTTMRNGATKWFRIKATGNLIQTTYYYDLQIDFPAQIREVSDPGDENGIYAVTYGLTGVYDPTWAKAFQIDVINTLTAL